MNTKRNRIFALILALAMVFAMLTACGGNNQTTNQGGETPSTDTTTPSTDTTTPDAPSEEDKYGGIMRMGLNSDLMRPNFILTSDGPAGLTRDICWEKLYGTDANGNLVPRLATGYEASEDGLTYTVHLREGVKWHDGEDLNADDVVFYHEYYQKIESVDKDETDPYTVEKVDDYTVKFVLESPNPFFADSYLGYQILPEHIWKDVDPAEWDNISDPAMFVGCGPFKFVEYKVGEYIRFERFDDYWDGKPYLDGITVQIIADKDALSVAFETGQLDYSSGISKTSYANLKDNPNYTFTELPTGNMALMLINHKDERLAELAVRQALCYLLDRESMTVAQSSLKFPMDSCITSSDLGYDNTAVDPEAFVYDVDKAIAVLEEAGWTLGADGVREKDGKRLEFEMITWRSDADAMGVIAMESMKKAGINLTMRTIDLSLFVDRVFTPGSEDFELAYNGMTMGPLPNGYRDMYSVGTYTTYVSEETQALFEKMYAATDMEEIKDLMGEIQTIVTTDRAAGWIYEGVTCLAQTNGLNCEDCGLSGLYQEWVAISKAYFEK